MRTFDRPQYALEMKNDRCAFVAFATATDILPVRQEQLSGRILRV